MCIEGDSWHPILGWINGLLIGLIVVGILMKLYLWSNISIDPPHFYQMVWCRRRDGTPFRTITRPHEKTTAQSIPQLMPRQMSWRRRLMITRWPPRWCHITAAGLIIMSEEWVEHHVSTAGMMIMQQQLGWWSCNISWDDGVEEMAIRVDNSLFCAVRSNVSHVLHYLFLPFGSAAIYSLRQRPSANTGRA